MAKGTKGRTAAAPPSHPPPDDDDLKVDQETGEIFEDDTPEFESDGFTALWETDAQGRAPQRVQLNRILPKIMVKDPETGIDYSLCGRLEDLPPGLENYRGYIQERYGGGTYQAQRYVRNERNQVVINKSETIEIAGIPRLPRPDRRESIPAEIVPGTTQLAPPVQTGATIKIEGADIPLDADMNDILKWMVKLKAIREAFPDKAEPTHPDSVLLQMLLNERRSNETDPAKLIESIGGVVGAVREMMPAGDNGGGGGDGVWSVVNKAIDAFSQYLRTVGARQPLPHPGLIPVETAPAKQITAVPVENGEPELKPVEAEPMAGPMTKLQAAQIAISNINAAFQVSPRKEPARVVRMLDNVLGLDKDQRGKIQPLREDLFDMAHVAINEQYEDIDAQEFEAYFYKVFDLYVDPNREMVTLEGKL